MGRTRTHTPSTPMRREDNHSREGSHSRSSFSGSAAARSPPMVNRRPGTSNSWLSAASGESKAVSPKTESRTQHLKSAPSLATKFNSLASFNSSVGRPQTVPAQGIYGQDRSLVPGTPVSLLPHLDGSSVHSNTKTMFNRNTKTEDPWTRLNAATTDSSRRSGHRPQPPRGGLARGLSGMREADPSMPFTEEDFEMFYQQALLDMPPPRVRRPPTPVVERPPSSVSSVKTDVFGVDDEPTPRGLHLVPVPRSRPPSGAPRETLLLSAIPDRVARAKEGTIVWDKWALGIDVGREGSDSFADKQVMPYPRTLEQAANAGAPCSSRELGHRLVKRLDWDLPALAGEHRTSSANNPNARKLSPEKTRPATTHFDKPRTPDCGSTTLNLSHSKMGPRELFALSLSLPGMTQLHTLTISGNAVDDACARTLVAGLRSANCIRHLDVSHNHITAKGAKEFAAHLFRVSKKDSSYRPKIQYFSISGNHIGDQGVTVLAQALARDPTIRDLEFADCGFGEYGAVHVAEILEDNKSLHRLDVSKNLVGVKGAQAIGEGLRNHPKIKTLLVAQMGLGDLGAAYIVQALQENLSIKKLDISRNNIRSTGTAVLCAAVKLRETLEYLDMSYNPIGKYGGERLLEIVMQGIVGKMQLEGCSFMEVGYSMGTRGIINRRDPEGTYELDLSHPMDHQMLFDLVELSKVHGEKSWAYSSINGKEFKIGVMDWPADIPFKGKAVVRFVSARSIDRTMRPMSEEQFANMWTRTSAADQKDDWKLGLLKLLSCSVFVTAAQVETMLKTFSWGPERSEACMSLFGRLVDPHNQHLAINTLSADGRVSVCKQLGALRFYHPTNPTGYYNLNLSRTVDFSIAQQLLDLYASEVNDGLLGGLDSCWRNVMLDGKLLEEVDPCTFQLKPAGQLRLDYVTYRVYTGTRISPTIKSFSDLRLECLMQCMCMDPPVDEFELANFQRKYFKDNFYQIWESNWSHRGHAGGVRHKSSTGPQRRKSVTDDKNFKAPVKAAAKASAKSSAPVPQADTLPTRAASPRRTARRSIHLTEDIAKPTKDSSPPEGAESAIATPVERKIKPGNEERVLHGLRVLSLSYHVLCKHLLRLAKLFTQDKDIVELVVIFYSHILDRNHFADLMRGLSVPVQSGIGLRIGYQNFWDPLRPDYHFHLRLFILDEYEVAKRLKNICVKDKEISSYKNLKINGRTIPAVTEDESVWGILTGHVMDGVVSNNVLDFDFLISKSSMHETAARVIQKFYRLKFK